jgi:hypothetical protein
MLAQLRRLELAGVETVSRPTHRLDALLANMFLRCGYSLLCTVPTTRIFDVIDQYGTSSCVISASSLSSGDAKPCPLT